jgi:8-oxo-dGTP diphosphatase
MLRWVRRVGLVSHFAGCVPMNSYVLGFCFERRTDQVVLIRKVKPEWQRDKLNGVGGKIEGDETPTEAMVREWREETGEDRDHWEQFLSLNFPGASVYCFRAFCDLSMANTVTDEKIIRVNADSLQVGKHYFGYKLMNNLPWLVAFALSNEEGHMNQQ